MRATRWIALASLGAALGWGIGQPVQAQAPPPTAYTLDDLTRLALQQHPRLAQAGFAVEGARGRAVQAGLYPNPFVQFTADEMSDRTGPGGILNLPYVSQEIVTADKLKLDRAAANREVDQAALTVAETRMALLSDVRVAYYTALAASQRVQVLRGAVAAADQLVAYARQLYAAKQIPSYQVLKLEATAEQARAELATAEQELEPTFRQLAATVGVPHLPVGAVTGSLEEPLPTYELESTLERVLASHPEVISARIGVDRAQLLRRRATAERRPNITVYGGYTYQSQNLSHDWAVGVGMPLPLWNRNQGNIQAAQAQVGEAVQGVERARAVLADRVSAAFRDYTMARERVERYRTQLRPRLRQAAELTLEAQKQGSATLNDVSQAQSAAWDAEVQYVRALQEAWRAASVLSGLTGEEIWPRSAAVIPAAKK